MLGLIPPNGGITKMDGFGAPLLMGFAMGFAAIVAAAREPP